MKSLRLSKSSLSFKSLLPEDFNNERRRSAKSSLLFFKNVNLEKQFDDLPNINRAEFEARFDIEGSVLVGKGGVGEVYLVKDKKHENKIVAMKVVELQALATEDPKEKAKRKEREQDKFELRLDGEELEDDQGGLSQSKKSNDGTVKPEVDNATKLTESEHKERDDDERKEGEGLNPSKSSKTSENTLIKGTLDEIRRELSIVRLFPKSNFIIQFFFGFISQSEQSIILCMEPAKMNLNKIVQKQRFHLSLLEIQAITFSIISGLAEIHARNIIHFDIKPCNILLTSNGKVKICDFGSATTSEIKKKTSSTIYYCAPEVSILTNMSCPPSLIHIDQDFLFKDFDLAKRADVWSLGMTLLELFTKDHPFSVMKAKNASFGRALSKEQKEDLSRQLKQEIKNELANVLQNSLLYGNQHRVDEYESFFVHILEYVPNQRLSRQSPDFGFYFDIQEKLVERFSENSKNLADLTLLIIFQDLLTSLLMVNRELRPSVFQLKKHKFVQDRIDLKKSTRKRPKTLKRRRKNVVNKMEGLTISNANSGNYSRATLSSKMSNDDIMRRLLERFEHAGIPEGF